MNCEMEKYGCIRYHAVCAPQHMVHHGRDCEWYNAVNSDKPEECECKFKKFNESERTLRDLAIFIKEQECQKNAS